ncbi:LOW QUALITY PROTEIN: hypothetical protein CVT26_006156 [Gymnopilus dilepis]|uniref:Uncharacterized protein n=1 Tax=Gymnopilus dilepis TaxID=231916 RepID=A0A409X4Q9_9AGAR|nr:LOW QUALITY PROTEIN: hypothetical protein CVT26_006156 [Gymnopilus dilepis]
MRLAVPSNANQLASTSERGRQRQRLGLEEGWKRRRDEKDEGWWRFDYALALGHIYPPRRAIARRGWIFSFPFDNTTPRLPRVEDARPPRPPLPPSYPIFAREDEQEVEPDPGAPTLSRQARAHLPRIEEQARGGCSTVWCSGCRRRRCPHCRCWPCLSTCHQAERVSCVLGVTPAFPLPLARRAEHVAGAVAPRYHQPTPLTLPWLYALAMCEFRVDAAHQTESDVGASGGAAATMVYGHILLCLRMQAGGGIVSLAWRWLRGANRLARSQDAGPLIASLPLFLPLQHRDSSCCLCFVFL